MKYMKDPLNWVYRSGYSGDIKEAHGRVPATIVSIHTVPYNFRTSYASKTELSLRLETGQIIQAVLLMFGKLIPDLSATDIETVATRE